jgi:hypothetical protein
MYFNLQLHYRSIFFIRCFMKYVYLRDRCRTCTSGYVANLCAICSGTMHLTYLAYFRQHENDDCYVLSDVYLYVSFIHNFDSVTLLFSDTLISACDQRIARLCYQNQEWKIHKADSR